MFQMNSVNVALRIRPFINNETKRNCIVKIKNRQEVLFGKQIYTYNYVFDEHDDQSKVYGVAVKPLINHLLKGKITVKT